MLSRFALLALAAATAVAPAAGFAQNANNVGTKTGSSQTLIWNGKVGASCTIQATKEGTLTLGANNQFLTSVGADRAELTYSAAGPSGTTFRILSTDSKVLLGNQDQLPLDNAYRVELNYNTGKGWAQVWQNGAAVFLDNQMGQSPTISGSGTLEVDVRTNAHLNRQNNNAIKYGNYTIRSVVGCYVK